jgi:hypothetical protein
MSGITIKDEGQLLPPPRGRLLGVVPALKSFEQLAGGLAAAGFSSSRALAGQDGISLLERAEQFFFSDLEDRVLAKFIQELTAGRVIFSVEVPSQQLDEARRIASEHGAQRMVYFGQITVTLLGD